MLKDLKTLLPSTLYLSLPREKSYQGYWGFLRVSKGLRVDRVVKRVVRVIEGFEGFWRVRVLLTLLPSTLHLPLPNEKCCKGERWKYSITIHPLPTITQWEELQCYCGFLMVLKGLRVLRGNRRMLRGFEGFWGFWRVWGLSALIVGCKRFWRLSKGFRGLSWTDSITIYPLSIITRWKNLSML